MAIMGLSQLVTLSKLPSLGAVNDTRVGGAASYPLASLAAQVVAYGPWRIPRVAAWASKLATHVPVEVLLPAIKPSPSSAQELSLQVAVDVLPKAEIHRDGDTMLMASTSDDKAAAIDEAQKIIDFLNDDPNTAGIATYGLAFNEIDDSRYQAALNSLVEDIASEASVPAWCTLYSVLDLSHMRKAIAGILRHIPSPSAAEALANFFSDPWHEEEVQREIITSLLYLMREYKVEAAGDALKRLLEHENRFVGSVVYEAIKAMSDSSPQTHALISAYEATLPSIEVTLSNLTEAEESDTAINVKGLIPELLDPDYQIHHSAVQLLVRLGAAAIPTLAQVLANLPSRTARIDMIWVLGRIPDVQSAKALEDWFPNEIDEALRIEITAALFYLRDKHCLAEAQEAFTRLLRHKSFHVHRGAIIASGNFKGGVSAVLPSEERSLEDLGDLVLDAQRSVYGSNPSKEQKEEMKKTEVWVRKMKQLEASMRAISAPKRQPYREPEEPDTDLD